MLQLVLMMTTVSTRFAEAGGLGNSTAGDDAAAGNVLNNDNDVDAPLGDELTVTAVRSDQNRRGGTFTSFSGTTTIAGIYGTLEIDSNGDYTYTLDDLDPDTQALDSGEFVQEYFTYGWLI